MALQTALAIWGIALVATVVFAAISYLLIAIPLAALFRKAGVEPWKAWVPVYSTYTWLQLGGQSGHWAWLSFIPYGSVVTSIFLYIGMYRTGKAFGKEGGFLVLGIFLPWVWLFILGFGRDEYRPERIAAAGLGAPLVGTGAVVPTARPAHYPASPYAAQPYPGQQYPGTSYTGVQYPPPGEQPGTASQPGTATQPGQYPPPGQNTPQG